MRSQGGLRRRWDEDGHRVRIRARYSLSWGLGLVPETSMPGFRPQSSILANCAFARQFPNQHPQDRGGR
jgi:hypothetical protein